MRVFSNPQKQQAFTNSKGAADAYAKASIWADPEAVGVCSAPEAVEVCSASSLESNPEEPIMSHCMSPGRIKQH